MKPETLIELIGGNDSAAVEQEWMRRMESPDASLVSLAQHGAVLAELRRQGRASQAEELAWTGIEAVRARSTPQETLTVAGPFLLAVGNSAEVRTQVVDLYRSVYGDREGFEELLEESGLGGGRPVRRALRTLDVVLALNENDYVASRDELGAARIELIDRSAWEFTLTCSSGTQTLGAVHLADQFRPAVDSEFAVMQTFDPQRLAETLRSDPVPMIVDICRRHDNKIDSDQLEELLVPDVLSATDWKKWWTRARTALRKCPNIKMEGRTPCVLTYADRPIALHEEMRAKFRALHAPVPQWGLVQRYVRDCKARGEEPSESALRYCMEDSARRAVRAAEEGGSHAGLLWAMSRAIADAGGIDFDWDRAREVFGTETGLTRLFAEIQDDRLVDVACTLLIEARPDGWMSFLLDLLPVFPYAVCDRTVERLVQAGSKPADFEPVVQRIMVSPAEYFDALMWLWDGPAQETVVPVPSSVTLLSRIIGTLEECRRSDTTSHETAKRIVARAKSVLAARKYERFALCLPEMGAGLAGTIRTRLRRLDSVGRAVREDMVRRLDRHYPPKLTGKTIAPWDLDDVLFVTKEGMARKQDEIEHHINVKMRENAVAIGHAAERGDLSENSEYKFALEERDLLRARLAQMNSEMAAARVLTPADVPTDRVGIGAKVVFRRVKDGSPYELTIIGPWEADSAKGIINYGAPLARKILGKSIGEVVEFEHTGAVGKYEIVTVESALSPADQTE